MLFYLLFTLATWNGVMGTDDTCTGSYRACAITHEQPSFPKTEEDIDQKCPYLAQYLDCLKDYADRCGYESVHHRLSEDRYKELKTLIDDICRKDSKLHLRIVQNIGCIGEMMDKPPTECRESTRNQTEILRLYIKKKEVEGHYDQSIYDYEIWMPFTCVTESLRIACFASNASKNCGSDVQDIVLEIVHRSGTIRDACPSHAKVGVDDLIRILELESGEELFLRDIINKE